MNRRVERIALGAMALSIYCVIVPAVMLFFSGKQIFKEIRARGSSLGSD